MALFERLGDIGKEVDIEEAIEEILQGEVIDKLQAISELSRPNMMNDVELGLRARRRRLQICEERGGSTKDKANLWIELGETLAQKGEYQESADLLEKAAKAYESIHGQFCEVSERALVCNRDSPNHYASFARHRVR